ncbi:MAG TPA: DUF6161 domain-containing protein [Planctomycetaceae bacterium]|jgi:hypothetical protein|nr:DUF6161 domain-containing protein [Planctomycetaceae bacterium]
MTMEAFESAGIQPLFIETSQLIPWVDTQIQAWERLVQKAAGGGPIQGIFQRAVTNLNSLRQTIAQDQQGRDFNKTKDAIKGSFGLSWFPNGSAEFKLIDYGLTNYGEEFTGGLITYLFSGRLNQAGFWKGPDGRTFALLERERVPRAANFQRLDDLIEEAKQQLQAGREEAVKWREAWEEKMNGLTKQYQKIKELAEPITYWQSRQSNRHKLAWAFGVAFVAFGSCGLAELLQMLRHHESLDAVKTSLADLSPTVQAIFVIREMIPPLVVAVGMLWGLRLLARLFLVQIHLQADASERVVMAQTFLSLLVGKGVAEGKEAVRPEDSTLILTQLFRHESTGVFPDDSAPQIPLLDLAKAVAPKPREG